jgi:hypothetical protein
MSGRDETPVVRRSVLHTPYDHAYHPDGSPMSAGECNGCWDIVRENDNVYLQCTQCSEIRRLDGLGAVAGIAPPPDRMPSTITLWEACGSASH